jgi:hypoxanthine-DNA glycosylase
VASPGVTARATSASSRAEGFPPVANRQSRVLVLGTLPGPESLRQRQYYAQPRNAFWRIMGQLIGAGPELPYLRRLEVLRAHRIALWDVCAAAHRVGALDSAIQRSTVEPNDIARFLRAHAGIGLVCFNGQTAVGLYRRLVMPQLPPELAGIEQRVLPSTSPAHAAMPYAQKLERWRAVMVGAAGAGRARRARAPGAA